MGKTRLLLILLAVVVVSGVLHPHFGHLCLMIHLIAGLTFTLLAVFHCRSHRKQNREKSRHVQQTAHITIDLHCCQACWKCVNACPKQVLGKIDLPFHKHVKIVNAEKCIGCNKCVKMCEFGVISANVASV
ncbi:MAG: ferredoxin family protein [Salinivirgaceae bacterium]|nr:ferredoxin family protein [Salinivirgaceae bacterium]